MTLPTGDRLDQRIRCHCGRWHWRYLVAGDGLTTVEKTCPKCEKDTREVQSKLVVFRDHQLLGVVPIPERSSRGYWQALSTIDGLGDDERLNLVDTAKRISLSTGTRG